MLEKLKGKYIFFDVDGTLGEYRYNDKIYAGRCPEFGNQTLSDLLFSDLFYRARPLKTMQNIISNLDANKVFISGIPADIGGENDYEAVSPATARYVRFSVVGSVTPTMKHYISALNMYETIHEIKKEYMDISLRIFG